MPLIVTLRKAEPEILDDLTDNSLEWKKVWLKL